jgi:hypothetical protein
LRRPIAYLFLITRKLLSKQLASLLVMTAASATLVAACGGGSGDQTSSSGQTGSSDQTYSVESDTTVTTASIAQSKYVPRINRICRKAWGVIVNNFAEYSKWQNPAFSARRRFIEAVRLSLIAGLTFYIFDPIHRMGAPRGEESEMEEVAGALQSASERAGKGLAPVSSVAQVAALYGDYNQRARAYGLDDCLVDAAHLKPIAS